MNRIGFQINNSGEEDIFKKFDESFVSNKKLIFEQDARKTNITILKKNNFI